MIGLTARDFVLLQKPNPFYKRSVKSLAGLNTATELIGACPSSESIKWQQLQMGTFVWRMCNTSIGHTLYWNMILARFEKTKWARARTKCRVPKQRRKEQWGGIENPTRNETDSITVTSSGAATSWKAPELTLALGIPFRSSACRL
jgi:hypothetical protein